MNIIKPNSFKIIEDVRLNRNGRIIGHIVRYKDSYYYLSHRTDEHFFIKFNGFGIGLAILNSLINRKIETDLQRKYGISHRINGIIIHYQGKRENRYYYADLDEWFLNSQAYGTSKVSEKNIETYGMQKILNKKHMNIFGYNMNDYEVINQKQKLNKWGEYR